MNQATEDIAKQFAAAAINRKQWGSMGYSAIVEGVIEGGVTDTTTQLQTLVNKAISEGRRTIFLAHITNGQYRVTALTNAGQVDFVGDNCSFVGGYTGTINPIGAGDVTLRNQLFNQGSLADEFNIYDYKAATDPFTTTFTITKDNHSAVGPSTAQACALAVFDSIAPECNNYEIGILSQLNVNGNSLAHVAIYSQINASGAVDGLVGAAMHTAAFELSDVLPGPNNTAIANTSKDHAFCGLEVDIKTSYNYVADTKYEKLGVICVAWGGGQCAEAFSVRTSGGQGDGVHLTTGDWRYGFRILPESVNAANGVGLSVESRFKRGVSITGEPATNGYGINVSSPSVIGGTVGLNIGNYAIGIALNGSSLKLNTAGSNEMMYYDPGKNSTNITTAVLSLGTSGLIPYNTAVSAVAGSATLPANPAGFFELYLNGTKYKVPYYNV